METLKEELTKYGAVPEKRVTMLNTSELQYRYDSGFNQALDSIDYTKLEQYFREKFVEEIDSIREDDSCECDNCKIMRNYIKNPFKEVHRRKQQLLSTLKNNNTSQEE